MSLDDYAAPECQFADCDADAAERVDHPDHGAIQVCATCAQLWEESNAA